MTFGSLFSGIGGLDLALEAFGHEVAWQAEIDPHARAVLAHHWPGVHCYKDVREIDGSAVRVDLVCGGFPCQPHSLAGKRRGTSDARWLWPEFCRIVREVRPSFVFVENVPGLRTSGLSVVLADLAALGFDAEWGCFSAAEVGAPHRRVRLHILAYATNGRAGRAVRLYPGTVSGASHGRMANGGHEDLEEEVARRALWPTPAARTGAAESNLIGTNSRPLNEVVHAQTPGQLNPTWVEWLMGFPPEHTACASSVTPSSGSKPRTRSKP